MNSKETKENEIVDELLRNYSNKIHDLSDKYILLMVDYLYTLNNLKEGFSVDINKMIEELPNLVTSVKETELYGLSSKTEKTNIEISEFISEDEKKLEFFKQLTHLVQSNDKVSGFETKENGKFINEGSKQLIAEILYNASNNDEMINKEQHNTVECHPEHIVFSPLTKYQLNGNMLFLLANSLNIKLNNLLSLSFKKNGREILKTIYESVNDNSFEDFMENLDKIFYIDKLLKTGHFKQLKGEPILIQKPNRELFTGNLAIESKIINQTERELSNAFITNNDEDYIINNYTKIVPYLTTSELRKDFIDVINSIKNNKNKTHNLCLQK